MIIHFVDKKIEIIILLSITQRKQYVPEVKE